MNRIRIAFGAALISLLFPLQTEALEFHLTFDRKVHDQAFTGRVYVMLASAGAKGLQSGPSWFSPRPFFAKDVKDWKPGELLVFDRTALGYPVTVDRMPKASYSVQAVMDLALNARSFSQGPGNVWTVVPKIEIDPAKPGPVVLKLDRIYREPVFSQTDRIKLVDVESTLLTHFHKRRVRLRAGVVLPKSYATSPNRKYPVVYEIPGFSGNHFMASRTLDRTNLAGLEVIHVMLDPDCHHGHHVFADSANNGPCGKALVEELIPAIESRFRAIGKPGGRAVTGHSSGGWSSLWLQVTYPEFFGGVWSTAPDPVDFHDFQKIDVYRPGENMFTDRDGKPRHISRRDKPPFLLYKGFSDMEVVMGHGGQLRSFEAVFSERGADGQPKPLWDRKTGAIDPDVAKSWEKYDIRLVLERNWKTLGPKLQGKIHVCMGELDSFYLEGATRRLKLALAALDSDAVVELFPGKNHGSLMTTELRARIAREMAAMFKAAEENGHEKHKKARK
jgi:S-formylglutathione hydrolase FrmB